MQAAENKWQQIVFSSAHFNLYNLWGRCTHHLKTSHYFSVVEQSSREKHLTKSILNILIYHNHTNIFSMKIDATNIEVMPIMCSKIEIIIPSKVWKYFCWLNLVFTFKNWDKIDKLERKVKILPVAVKLSFTYSINLFLHAKRQHCEN